MRRLAHYALSLALGAETVERSGQIPDHVLAVMRDREQLISEALDESALQGTEKNPTALRRESQRLRLRAKEYRNLAEACRNDGSHYTYRYLARSCERLAERAERMATLGETEGVGRQGNVRARAASGGAPVPTTGRKAAPDVPSGDRRPLRASFGAGVPSQSRREL